MTAVLPEFLELQYSRSSISERVQEMGQQLNEWCAQVSADGRGDVIGVPVLRGGIFFFADLVRSISHSIDIAPVRTWGYVAGAIGQQVEELKLHLYDLNPKGRAVLLIDDLCDSGRTMQTLSQTLIEMGAAEVRSAVLIKRLGVDGGFDPDYVGFNYSGAEWFVGYGMDLEDRWRNLPDVYVVRR
jgi:hypoxanthine phosphoribosyltransferase